jgi:hypothetical protein
MVDLNTGLRANSNTKKTIYESFKSNTKTMINLEKIFNKGTLEFSNLENNKKIFRFY